MTEPHYSFDWTISPHTSETFFDTYFEKKPLLIQRNAPDYYSDLLSSADIDRVVCTMGLSTPEITVTRADANITAADFAYESGYIDPVRVSQLFADGATVILSGLHERLPKLAQFCRALEGVMSARVQTNIYMTPANSQGFKAHYDAHDVLVLQVEGTKEWRIYDTPVELPLNTQAFNPHDVEVGPETERFLLEPGDMLYVPRGVAHDAVSTDQTSLHITTGLMLRSWADLMVEAVNVMAHTDPDFRKALPPGHGSPDFDPAAFQDRFAQLADKITNGAPVAKLFEGFKQDFLTGRMPRVEGQMAQLAKLPGLRVEDTVSARPNLVYGLSHLAEEGQLRIVSHGAEILLPDHAMEAVEFCLTSGPFRVADMAGDLDDPGKLVLVRRLVREGLMQVV